MYVLLYVYLISHILLVFCNYTLVPSQVLLPRTSFYRCRKTGHLLTVNVQFVLKIEPSLCVNWKLQDSQVLLFDKSNYTALQKSRGLEDSQEYENYNENELKGCSSSVVLTTVPLNFKDDTTNNLSKDLVDAVDENGNRVQMKTSLEHVKDSSDVKTFVFAYDSNFRFHAVAEVVVSKLDRLTVETAYRKVSKNQTFSLKLRGLDRDGNTFSSLEGLPFYLSFEGPRIFEVLDVNEGELYSEKRASVLSQVENFSLPEGTTLVTDLVMFKGVKVGRATLKFGLFLDEYSRVLSAPVEFVVNDSVVLSHRNLYMLDNTSFQLRLQYPTSGHLYPNGKPDEVNMMNYEWSTDGDVAKVTLSQQGLLKVHLFSTNTNKNSNSSSTGKTSTTTKDYGSEDSVDSQGNLVRKSVEDEYKCVVYVKDLRTNEVMKSYVNVMRPYSLMLKYNSLQSVNNCLLNKSLVLSKDSELFSSEEGLDKYLEKLVELNDQEGEECYNYDFKQKEDAVYLFENNYYLFKFNLMTYNKNLFNTFDSTLLTFTSTGSGDRERDQGTGLSRDGDKLVELVRHKQNYYVYKAKKLGCSYYNLSYGSGSSTDAAGLSRDGDKLVHKYKLCVLEQVKLPGYECKKKLKVSNNYEYSVCEKPLVVSVGDVFKLSPKGGSGKYRYELDGCYNEGDKFVCTEKGSYQLKVVDANNEENGLVLQLVSTTVSSSEFEYLGPGDLSSLGSVDQDSNSSSTDKTSTTTKDNKDKGYEQVSGKDELNVRVNKGLKVKLNLYGDLSGFKPMFKKEFNKEDSELYSFNYSVGFGNNALVATMDDVDRLEELYTTLHSHDSDTSYTNGSGDRERDQGPGLSKDDLKLLSYDKNVLELKDYDRDSRGSLVVVFKTVSVNSTKLELNTNLLLNMYNKELGKDGGKVYLNESEFKKLLVNVYKDPVLYVNEKYKLPVINLATVDKMNRTGLHYNRDNRDNSKESRERDNEVLANVALGAKVELNYKFGLKGSKAKLSNKTNNNVVYVENLEENRDSDRQGFMVYCVNVGEEELLFELLDYSKVYKVTCSLPKYNKLYPLNKLSSDLYELVDQQNVCHLRLQGLGGDDLSEKFRYMVNKNKVNRYVNLLYDNKNNLLLPSDLYQSTFHLYTLDVEVNKSNRGSNSSSTDKTSTTTKDKNEKLVGEGVKYGSVFEFDMDEDMTTSSSSDSREVKVEKDKNQSKENKEGKVEREYKVVGYYKYYGNSDYYSEKFNRMYKFKKFNQMVVNSLKSNNWEYKNKQYVMSTLVYLLPKYNHSLLLQVDEDSREGKDKNQSNEYHGKTSNDYKEENDVYLMYNKMFVYKLYVHGGSGSYSLSTGASEFKYSFSKLYTFPEHFNKVDKEKMVERDVDKNEVLPVNVDGKKEVVVNLFDYGRLKGSGRFLTFTTSNMNGLVLNVKDEGLLWQDTVNLRLHFRYPNNFELVLSPYDAHDYNNKAFSIGDVSKVVVKEEKEEFLYYEDKHRMKLKGYYNGHRLMSNSLLLVFKLLNSNLGVKSSNGSKVYLQDLQDEYNSNFEEYYDNQDTEGEDELVLSTYGLGSGGMVVSDLDGNLKKTYRFKVINKLLLNYNKVTVLPDTQFDVTFENMSCFNNLKVTTSALGSGSGSSTDAAGLSRDDKLVHSHSLGFKQLGLYKYNVNVMYNNNLLTRLNHKLLVNVSKPARMAFHLSSLDSSHSSVLGYDDLESGSKDENKGNENSREGKNKNQSHETKVGDDNLYEYVVDRDAVVNLNVLLFDQDNNLFTPLYLNNNKLEFEYKLSGSCRLVGYGSGYSGYGLGNGDSNSSSTNKTSTTSSKDRQSKENRMNEQVSGNRVVVTNKYNVLLSVGNNCDVVVTSKYNGVSLQSKKLRFKVKMPERLFSELDSVGGSLFKENLGFGENVEENRESKDNEGYADYSYGRDAEFGQCRSDDENLCFGGVYEVKRAFRSYPESKLKELGNHLYKVTSLGSVMLTTEANVYNVKLLKPTHFSLVHLNYDGYGTGYSGYGLGSGGMVVSDLDWNNGNDYGSDYSKNTRSSSSSNQYHSNRHVDFVSYNMNKLMFKVILFSNHKRLKMPRNAKFSVRMKDLSVFSYELEGDLLTLTPHKVGQTVVELVYSLGSGDRERDQGPGLSRDDLKLLYADEHRLNRVYFLRSGRYELTNVYNVMLGSQVYLTGSRVNGVLVNLDANSYEFQKFLKNRFTLKSYGTSCFGHECGVSYVNRNEYVDDVNKLKHLVNTNRTSYKVLLNVVTNALNTVFSYSVDQRNFGQGYGDLSSLASLGSVDHENQFGGFEKKKLFNMSNFTEKYLCKHNYCWLQLNFTLKNPVSLNQLNQANQLLHNYYNYGDYGSGYSGYASGRDGEDVEDVLKMLSSPLLGVDNIMWNSSEGVVKDVKVNSDRLGTHKFKNVNNEQVVTNVVRFDSTRYKFKQVDPSTLLLLPDYPKVNKNYVTREQMVRELDSGVFGNHGNVLYYNYGLNYHFKDSQLNKLFFLKLTYSPHVVHDSHSGSDLDRKMRDRKKKQKDNKSNDRKGGEGKVEKDENQSSETKVVDDSDKDMKMNVDVNEPQNVYGRKTGKLVYRLGYKLLLVNTNHREWSVLKNHLRTMTSDLLKGKHKLSLQLYYSHGSGFVGKGSGVSNSSSTDKTSTTTKDREDKSKMNEQVSGKDEVNVNELLDQELEVDLPESVVFVNSEGFLVNELNESNLNHVLHVYPVSSSHKLHLTNNNYVVKTVERSGQLATFMLYSNDNGDSTNTTPADKNKLLFNRMAGEYDQFVDGFGFGTGSGDRERDQGPGLSRDASRFAGSCYLMVLNSSNHVVGRIKISSNLPTSTFSFSRFSFFNNRSLSEVLLLALTLVVLVFFFFVYNTLRNHHYYQPTVPIKLERTLPKAFDHLQQTRYHYRYHPH